MRAFLKRLFGRLEPKPAGDTRSKADETRVLPVPAAPAARKATDARLPAGGSVSDRYFALSGAIESAKADGDFANAIRAARETYSLFPAFVRKCKKEYKRFDIQTSHAVHTASTLMAVMGDREAISELRQTLLGTPELHQWLAVADDAEGDLVAVEGILAAVAARPGVPQNKLKETVGSDARRLSTLAAWLEKARRISRVREGATYRLYLAGHRAVGETGAARADKAAQRPARRSARVAARARPLAIKALPYVRLPAAPQSWGKTGEIKQRSEALGKGAHFRASGSGWIISKETPLPPGERPDPAFRQMYPTAGSTWWLDAKGQRASFPSAPAIAFTTDRGGVRLAERGLDHDVYRADINGDGSGMLFLSREGILHGYSETFEPLLLESVADIPEYAAQAQRFGITPTALKNHTRCVALSTDRSRYLLTVVDEAWCYDVASGQPLWGLRFPAKEGWTDVTSNRSGTFGTSDEIAAALRLMELELPVSQDAMTSQYRALALRWHPDRNPHDAGATRRFQDLVAAMQLLTGADVSSVSGGEVTGAGYERVLGRDVVAAGDGTTATLTVTMQIGGAWGADWIYAANLARTGHSAFLGGYSGQVVEVDSSGVPVRIYDIGAVPRHVADTGKHRYILTDTRLYVLSDDSIEAIVDVAEKGDLIVGDLGVGILEPKRFQWFTPSGELLGTVQTRDPIRRIYSCAEGLVVETRTRRAVTSGAQSWW